MLGYSICILRRGCLEAQHVAIENEHFYKFWLYHDLSVPTDHLGEINSKHEYKITLQELFLAPQHKRSASYLTFVDFYWLTAGLVYCTVVEANSILLKWVCYIFICLQQ